MSPRRYVLNFTGSPQIQAELELLLPGYTHIQETADNWLRLITTYPPFTIAHTAATVGSDHFRTALALAPTRMLAYDRHGERFHLHPRQPLSSLLFCNGLPVHRIHLRPWRDDTVHFPEITHIAGRATDPALPTTAILSPYLPWPLSHGGAVRIFHMLREAAKHSNLHLYAFTESAGETEPGPLRELCSEITLVGKPDFRRLPWASHLPAEVLEYDTPAMRTALAQSTATLRQTEFTQLAGYGGDILVEHDITMDLAAQQHARLQNLASWWNLHRWRRYERRQLARFRSIVVMSEKDKLQIAHPNIHVLPNGVDLQRFVPTPEVPGNHLLFIGSFRHYPNALAFRFLIEEFWPLMQAATLTVVAGPDPELYYPFGKIPRAAGVTLHSFVADVRPLYESANLVLIPTPVSAGTNIKALEAMAMQRAILSTPSGINGLDLVHGHSAWVASTAEDFAASAQKLLAGPNLRATLAANARALAEQRYDWTPIGKLQESLWRSLQA